MKGNDVIGLPIITMDNGKNVADVHDLIYDPQTHRVRALLINAGGWFSDAKIVPFNEVESIGRDAVMIPSENAIKKAGEISERIAHIAKDDTYLTKTKIMTDSGSDLGSVSDIYFDDKSGEVSELEVSQGLRNLQSGKKRVKISDIITIGEDATIVRAYTEVEMAAQAQQQGIQGAINTGKIKTKQAMEKAGQKTRVTVDQAREQAPGVQARVKEDLASFEDAAETKVDELRPEVEEAGSRIKHAAIDVTQRIKTKLAETQEAMEDRRKKEALGKYLTVNVLTPNDKIIAKRGDMVTTEVIHQAETHGMLDKVLGNTAKEPQ